MSLAVNRYADALLDVSVEENCLDEVYEQFQTLYKLLKGDERFRRLVTEDFLNPEEKKKLLATPFQDGNPYFKGFLLMLCDRSRTDEIMDMFRAFEKGYKEKKNILEVEAVTSIPLGKAQEDRLVESLAEKYGKHIVLTKRVDPSILGGMVIYMGDEMLDSSLKTKYEGLRAHLKTIQI